jgi:SH3-like domain-containing protein
MNNFLFFKTRLWKQRCLLVITLNVLLSSHVHADNGIEFLSISDHAVIMYDAPSLKSEKLYVASRFLPVEAVVNVEGWVKVRDSSGILAWVEKKSLSKKRYIIVTAPLADVYRSADTHSSLVFQTEKNVVMEWVDSADVGWVKVRHPDGQLGYIRVTQVWGI